MYIYEVRPGDTLTGIARRLGVTRSQLAAANRMPLRQLTPGQALIIPTDRYVVQPGDTLERVARRSGLSLAELRAANPGVETLSPGQVLLLPRPEPYQAEVLGYLPILEPQVTAEDIAPWSGALTYVAIFSYLIDGQGNMTEIDDEPAIRATYAAGARPLMVIANMEPGGAFSPEIARAIIADPQVRERVISAILRVVEQKGYAGVDSDIENIPAGLRAGYVNFLQELRARLEAEKLLTVAVPPKWDEETFAYARGHDYAGIGQVADRIVLMNYEFHWVGGPPGPIAPLPSVRRVLEYATSLMPREKLLNGISITAYDWPLPDTPENRAVARSSLEAVQLAVSHQVPIRYDQQAQTPWFRYRDGEQEREVWFEDARSLLAKLQLVKQFNLAGISIWHLGAWAPQLRPLILRLFQVVRAGR